MFSAGRRGRNRVDIWPGFVDALATLLLVFVFMLTVFMTAQHYLSDALSERDLTLEQLRSDLQELADLLAMERREHAALAATLEETEGRLEATLGERAEARARVTELESETRALRSQLTETQRILAASRQREEALEERLAALEEEHEATVGTLARREADIDLARREQLALRQRLEETEGRARALEEERDTLASRLDRSERSLAEAEARGTAQQVRLAELRDEIVALRQQLTAISAALDIAESTVAAQRIEIEDLGRRLNLALAAKVQELEQYRSEFFGRLREALDDHPDIEIDGDRFRFQSELFFETASAEIGPEGREQIRRIAAIIDDLGDRIPDDVAWVLQVEGHTDQRPIHTPRFPSNWELSAARALSIVHALIEEGIPPDRLSAAGFGEHRPVDDADTPGAHARNRRIELRLTDG